jgi:hypothetical protein
MATIIIVSLFIENMLLVLNLFLLLDNRTHERLHLTFASSIGWVYAKLKLLEPPRLALFTRRWLLRTPGHLRRNVLLEIARTRVICQHEHKCNKNGDPDDSIHMYFQVIFLFVGVLPFFGSAGAGNWQLQAGHVVGFMDLYVRYPSMTRTSTATAIIINLLGDLKRELLLL